MQPPSDGMSSLGRAKHPFLTCSICSKCTCKMVRLLPTTSRAPVYLWGSCWPHCALIWPFFISCPQLLLLFLLTPLSGTNIAICLHFQYCIHDVSSHSTSVQILYSIQDCCKISDILILDSDTQRPHFANSLHEEVVHVQQNSNIREILQNSPYMAAIVHNDHPRKRSAKLIEPLLKSQQDLSYLRVGPTLTKSLKISWISWCEFLCLWKWQQSFTDPANNLTAFVQDAHQPAFHQFGMGPRGIRHGHFYSCSICMI